MDTFLTAIKPFVDLGLGGISLALFFRLGKIVADHEIRIVKLEGADALRFGRRRRR